MIFQLFCAQCIDFEIVSQSPAAQAIYPYIYICLRKKKSKKTYFSIITLP